MILPLIKKVLVSNPNGVRKATGIFYNATRSHWNYQYKPGPYPRTPRERAEAAKKYGMTVEEYQPYPEDMCYGDYPKLPDIGSDSKDADYPYDFPELKRNFNEPIHASQEIIGEDRYDISMKPRFSLTHQWSWFLGVMGSFFFLYFTLDSYKIGRPVTEKQFPQNGPHFMFCGK